MSPEDSADGDDPEDDTPSRDDTPPGEVVDEAVRLSRLAREAVDDAEAAAYRADRDELLADHGYEARIREDDGQAVLACYPTEWVEEGTVQMDQVDDVSRGVERPLEGPGLSDDWEAVAEHNRELAEQVRSDHGDVHGDTADALAAFASNHYAKAIERLTDAELAEFREEFFPRNSWPTEAQRERVAESVRLTVELADEE